MLTAVVAALAAGAQSWYESYERGLALERQGSWSAALVEFQAAATAKPLPARRAAAFGRAAIPEYDPYYHAALCLVELGRPGLALQQLKRSAAAHVTPPDKLRALRERIQSQARARPAATAGAPPGRLAVESDPRGAAVWVDDVPRGAAPLAPLALPAGLHVVRAELSGYASVERHVTVVPGETATLMMPLAAALPAPTAALPSPAPDRAVGIPAPRRPLGALAALVILALLAVGGARRWRARRRGASPLSPTPPTRGPEQATTLAERGARLGEYELQGVLGRGGMATTFRARRASDGKAVAVKVPHDACLADPTFVARFLREGALGEQLHHPGIVRVLAAGEEDGRPYLAMELIGGRTLKEEVRAVGPLPLRRALEIARDIAEALDYAHAKGVVHRDLKPENVMILPDASVRVMDFGIARTAAGDGLTTSNVFLGTPLYAAPEMVDPTRVDHRADLYSLGIILYEMLEGTVPFVADSPYRVLEMHLHAPLPSPERLARRVPEPVWAVVARLCGKSPEDRYPGAEALLVELNRLLHDFSTVEGGDVF